MPLYLLPLPKTDGEAVVQPWQSMGGKAFDPDDPESMEFLRRLHDEKQQQIQPWKRSWLTPVFALFGFRFPPENPTVTNFRERWGRPFEHILAEATASPDDFLVREYDPEIMKKNKYLSGVERYFPWFPFYLLYEFKASGGEMRTNHVVINDSVAEDAFLSFDVEVPKQPDEMRASLASLTRRRRATNRRKTMRGRKQAYWRSGQPPNGCASGPTAAIPARPSG